jgi:hypothetical protein
MSAVKDIALSDRAKIMGTPKAATRFSVKLVLPGPERKLSASYRNKYPDIKPGPAPIGAKRRLPDTTLQAMADAMVRR